MMVTIWQLEIICTYGVMEVKADHQELVPNFYINITKNEIPEGILYSESQKVFLEHLSGYEWALCHCKHVWVVDT